MMRLRRTSCKLNLFAILVVSDSANCKSRGKNLKENFVRSKQQVYAANTFQVDRIRVTRLNRECLMEAYSFIIRQ